MTESEGPQEDITQTVLSLPLLQSLLGEEQLEAFEECFWLIISEPVLPMILDASMGAEDFSSEFYHCQEPKIDGGEEDDTGMEDGVEAEIEHFFECLQQEAMEGSLMPSTQE